MRWLWPSDRLEWNLGRSAFRLALALMLVVPGVRLRQTNVRLERADQLIAELSSPQTNVKIFHINSTVREFESASVEQKAYVVGPDDHFFAVTITVEIGFEPRQVRILDLNGAEIWGSRDLSLDPLKIHLRLGLSRYFLNPGDYLIEVSGLEDGVPVAPRLYPVRFEYR